MKTPTIDMKETLVSCIMDRSALLVTTICMIVYAQERIPTYFRPNFFSNTNTWWQNIPLANLPLLGQFQPSHE
jgi:hypothetical protein